MRPDLIKGFFRHNRNELRLIDFISFFYVLQIVFYTVDDMKSSYPIYLVISGILFHTLAILIFLKHKSIRTKPKLLKELIYKLTPIGLLITYSLSINEGISRGDITIKATDDITRFGITIIPILIYLFYKGFIKRTTPRIPILTHRIKALNVGYTVLYCLTLVVGEIIGH